MDINSAIYSRKYQLSGCTYSVSNTLSQFIYDKYDYSSIINNNNDGSSSLFGSVFNIEFTPFYYTVLVAHEKKAITCYDSRLENKRIITIPNAHNDCVNVITFLDNFTFASGSDDQTVRLWDLRQCGSGGGTKGCHGNEDKGLMYVLHGHQGWVKNIEYDRQSGFLFSMAFNDGVRQWDINNCHMYSTSNTVIDNLLFKASEGTRMKLSPDGTTMVISLRKDHLFVVSKFNGLLLNSSFPQRSLCVNDHDTISQLCLINETNVPTLHRLWPQINDSYHSPLSLSFHPFTGNSNQLLAMRVLGVDMYEQYYSVNEQLILYDALLKDNPLRPYYEYGGENAMKSLKSCREYSEEMSIDFIKEISFSTDGRLLVSPHRNTVRLLALDETCTPMDTYYDDRFHHDNRLEIIGNNFISCDSVCSEVSVHDSPVLTCRLNSEIMCLVSGSFKGTVGFTWPRL